MGWKVKHRSDQNKSQVILFETRDGIKCYLEINLKNIVTSLKKWSLLVIETNKNKPKHQSRNFIVVIILFSYNYMYYLIIKTS